MAVKTERGGEWTKNNVCVCHVIARWKKPRREKYMTHEYFADYQNEMSSSAHTKNGDSVGMYTDRRDIDHHEGNTWIPLSEMPGRVNNRKNSSGGRKFVTALRQLKQKYLTRSGNVTEDDSSGLLVDESDGDGDDDNVDSDWTSR